MTIHRMILDRNSTTDRNRDTALNLSTSRPSSPTSSIASLSNVVDRVPLQPAETVSAESLTSAKTMVAPRVLNELPADTVAAMGDKVQTREDEAKLKAEMAEERKQRLEEQRQQGLMLLGLACCLIIFGWMNGYVAWQFDYVAKKAGFKRFPLPDDIAAFFDSVVGKVKDAWQKKLADDEL